VIQELADAPFSRCVSFERFFFRYRRECGQEFIQLILDNVERIVADDLVDVGEIVRSGFVGLRAAVHGGDCNVCLSYSSLGLRALFLPRSPENVVDHPLIRARSAR